MGKKTGLTKKQAQAFVKEVQFLQHNPQPEKAVEKLVNTIIVKHFAASGARAENTYPHNTDGLITIPTGSVFNNSGHDASVLVEVKKDCDFSGSRNDIAKVLCQVVSYLRVFRDAGDILPTVTVIADQDEIFLIPTTILSPYVTCDTYDWSHAPSDMHKDSTLYATLIQDKNIKPHVHNMTVNGFDIRHVCMDVDTYIQDGDTKLEKIPVTKDNIVKLVGNLAFSAFNNLVGDVTSAKVCEIFYRTLIGDEDVYLHPKKKNTLVVDGSNIRVDAREFEYFWNHYDNGSYSLEELKGTTAIFDQNLDDELRRFHGDFFTPPLWGGQSLRVHRPGSRGGLAGKICCVGCGLWHQKPHPVTHLR